jgi:hypothetical protein
MMSEPSIVQYSTLDAGAEVALRTTQGKFNNSCSRDRTVSATKTHLARTSKPAKGSIMVQGNTAVERQQSFGAANPVTLDQLLTSTEESGSRVTFKSNLIGVKRTVRNKKKKPSLSPVDVSVTINKDGHAMVIDRRKGHFQGKQVGVRRNHSLGTHYRKEPTRVKLARELRRLASSVDEDPVHRLMPLLEEVILAAEELRKCIRKAERKALTTAFHGQPPGVVLE